MRQNKRIKMTTTVAQGDSTIAKTQNQEEQESLKTSIKYITNEISYIAWLERSRKLEYMSKNKTNTKFGLIWP